MHHIAIFASGKGTNAENIIRHFKKSQVARVVLLVCNHANAQATSRASSLGINTYIVSNDELKNPVQLLNVLEKHNISFIVLAGFLKLIPESIIHNFQNRIINIHPALLPKFGGKGMYGLNVHRAVIDAGEKESGITIHYVNEHFDEGEIIFQKKVMVDAGETPESLSDKIHKLEYANYPRVIEAILKKA